MTLRIRLQARSPGRSGRHWPPCRILKVAEARGRPGQVGFAANNPQRRRFNSRLSVLCDRKCDLGGVAERIGACFPAREPAGPRRDRRYPAGPRLHKRHDPTERQSQSCAAGPVARSLLAEFVDRATRQLVEVPVGSGDRRGIAASHSSSGTERRATSLSPLPPTSWQHPSAVPPLTSRRVSNDAPARPRHK